MGNASRWAKCSCRLVYFPNRTANGRLEKTGYFGARGSNALVCFVDLMRRGRLTFARDCDRLRRACAICDCGFLVQLMMQTVERQLKTIGNTKLVVDLA
jgi:hypothetical protein